MEYKIAFKKRYSKDIFNLLTYLEHEWGKNVADEFQNKINRALGLLKEHPYIGSPSRKIRGARGLLITKHNRLFYKIGNNTITILLLADTRRKNYAV